MKDQILTEIEAAMDRHEMWAGSMHPDDDAAWRDWSDALRRFLLALAESTSETKIERLAKKSGLVEYLDEDDEDGGG